MFCTMFYLQEKNCEGYGALNTCPSIGVAIPLIGEVPHVIFEKVSFVVVTWRLLEVYKPSGSTPRRERVLVHRSVWYRSNHQACCSSTLWNGWVFTWMIRYTVSKMNPQRATTVTVLCAGVDYPDTTSSPEAGMSTRATFILPVCLLKSLFSTTDLGENLFKKLLLPKN